MYISHMENKEIIRIIRRDNVRLLAKEAGSPADLCRKTGYSSSQISRIMSDKPIGEDLARALESKMGKPVYWLDKVHGLNDGLFEAAMQTVDEHLGANRKNLSDATYRKLVKLVYQFASLSAEDFNESAKDLIELVTTTTGR